MRINWHLIKPYFAKCGNKEWGIARLRTFAARIFIDN